MTGWVLGELGSDVTPVFAQSPGALELLPNKQYPPGWLRIADEKGRLLETYPKAAVQVGRTSTAGMSGFSKKSSLSGHLKTTLESTGIANPESEEVKTSVKLYYAWFKDMKIHYNTK